MPTLRDYFKNDFPKTLGYENQALAHLSDGGTVKVVREVHMDFDANAMFISYFVESSASTESVCEGLIRGKRSRVSTAENLISGSRGS